MSVETLAPSAVPPAAERDTLGKVEELLKGEAPESEAPVAEAPEVETPPSEAQAEEPVAPERLYAQKVKVGDGQELTVGELKDAWKSKTETETKFTEERANYQADRLRDQRELSQIISAIDPQHVRPELLQAWTAAEADYKSRMREQVLRTIPEWVDARTEEKDLAAIVEAIKPYGKHKADLEAIPDAGWRRLLRDHVKLKAELETLKTKPPPKVAVTPKKTAPQSPAQVFGRTKAAVTSGRLSPLAAVEQILKTSPGGEVRRR